MSDSDNKKSEITEQEIIETLDNMDTNHSKESSSKKPNKKKKSKAKKPSKMKGLKKEFKHITWLSGKEVANSTFAVVVISAILCVIIAVVDYIIQGGLNLMFMLGA